MGNAGGGAGEPERPDSTLEDNGEMPTPTSSPESGKAREILEVVLITQHTLGVEPSYPPADIDVDDALNLDL